MVELFLSTASHIANAELLCNLKKRRESGSTRHIVIVPDRFTLNTERNILEDLNLAGAFDITVTSFRRLSMKTLGKKAKDCMSAEGSVMLLSKVILDKKDELKYFINAHKKPGFASEIYAVLTLVRNSGISVDALDRASDNLPDLARKKCKDIVVLYKGYLDAISSGKVDGSVLLEKFKEEIPESDYIAESDIYISDYFSFTEMQRSVITALMKCARSVNIALVQGKGANARIYPQKELARIYAMAKSVGVSVKENYCADNLSLARKKVANELFAFNQSEKIQGGSGIRVYEAESVKEEITLLARRIKLLVKQGYRYKDISVLAGDVEGYLPTLKKVFLEEEIPYFANEQKLLSSTPIADFLTQAIKLSVEGLDRDNALTYLKNVYAGADEKDLSDFELYCVRYNVNYTRLVGEYTLGKSDKEYDGAKRVGALLSTILLKLAKESKVSEYVKELKEFILRANLEQKCIEQTKLLREKGNLLTASSTEQSYSKLIKTLDELEQFVGDSVMDKEGFLSMLSNALSSVKISFIPVYADSVYVGGAVESRFSDGKVFFIIGAKEGVLPAVKRGEGIFGDTDAELLRANEVELSPTSFETGIEEKLHVLQLLLMPKEKLFISYVKTGKSTSELIDGLTELFSDIKKENAKSLERDNLDEFLSLVLSTKSGAQKASLIENLCDTTKAYIKTVAGELQKMDKQDTDKIDCGEKLFFPYGSTSVTKIESYFRCPYRNFIENGLGARKLETAQSTSYVGTFMHRVFELGIKELVDKSFPTGKVFDDVVEKILKTVYAEEQFGALNTEKYIATKRRLSNEAKRALKLTSDRCRNSNYVPTGFEVRFGVDNKFVLKGEKTTVDLHGVVDRIDEVDGKALLLDYKTGKAPSSVKDVYYGTGVQLYVYMSAIENGGEKRTTGALYYPIVGDYEKEDQKGGRLSGFILSSEMSEFDKTFSPDEESDVFVYGISKGKPDKDAQKISCTIDEMESIKKYSLDVCAGAVDELADGYIDTTPLDKACDYCDFAVICKNKNKKIRKTRTLSKEVITGVQNG